MEQEQSQQPNSNSNAVVVPLPPPNIYRYFSRRECLRGRDAEYPLTPQMEFNLKELLKRINRLREKFGYPLLITSLYRPGRYNEAAGGARNSAHKTCEAVDFSDSTGSLSRFITPELLEELDLYMESPLDTVGWIHIQIRKPGSGKRIFRK